MRSSVHIRLILVALIATLGARAELARADQLDDNIALIVSQIKAHKPLDDIAIKKAPPLDVYRAVKPLLNDGAEDDTTTTLALSWITNATTRAANRDERLPGVAILLKSALSLKSPTNAFAFRSLVQVARTGDFDESQLKDIANLLEVPSPSKDCILLAGIAGSDLIVEHLHVLANGKNSAIANTSKLALARSGDKQLSESISKQFLASPLEDKMRRASELAYLRNSYAIEALRVCLNSDEEIPTDGDMIGEKLSHVALDNLRKFVDGFPEFQKYQIAEEDIVKAREWMKDRSDFKIKP